MVGSKGTDVSDGGRQSEINVRGSMCDPKPGLARWAPVYGAKTKVVHQIETRESVRARGGRAQERKEVKSFCWWCAFHAVRVSVGQSVCAPG